MTYSGDRGNMTTGSIQATPVFTFPVAFQAGARQLRVQTGKLWEPSDGDKRAVGNMETSIPESPQIMWAQMAIH